MSHLYTVPEVPAPIKLSFSSQKNRDPNGDCLRSKPLGNMCMRMAEASMPASGGDRWNKLMGTKVFQVEYRGKEVSVIFVRFVA